MFKFLIVASVSFGLVGIAAAADLPTLPRRDR